MTGFTVLMKEFSWAEGSLAGVFSHTFVLNKVLTWAVGTQEAFVFHQGSGDYMSF